MFLTTKQASMPLSLRENLIEDVIKITKLVEEYRDDRSAHSDAEQTQERFNDIHVHLCELMSSMISSPLSGRIFLTSPSAYVDEETREASLNENLLQKI